MGECSIMNLFDFSIARLPRIIFARKAIIQLPDVIQQYGNNVLLVFGAKSFESSDTYTQLIAELKNKNIKIIFNSLVIDILNI